MANAMKAKEVKIVGIYLRYIYAFLLILKAVLSRYRMN